MKSPNENETGKILTDLEKQVIENIINSEFMDAQGEEIIDYGVWSFSVTDERKDLAGALGSLVKKGLCVCQEEENDEICVLTREGYEWAKDNGLL